LNLDRSTPLQDASVRPEQLGGYAIVPVTDDRRFNSDKADEPYRHQQIELTCGSAKARRSPPRGRSRRGFRDLSR